MPYITRTDLLTELPALKLAEALDDDGDGLEDAGLAATICLQASDAVDAQLGAYTLSPVALKRAAYVFAMEMVYRRRARFGDANPFTDEAQSTRERLEKVQSGRLPGAGPVRPPGAAITEPCRTTGGGRL